MSLVQDIQNQIKQLLQSDDQKKQIDKLSDQLNALIPKNIPNEINILNQQIVQSSTEPTLVWINMMVQDIRQQQYSYSYLIKKPLNPQSELVVLKYGAKYSQELQKKIQDQTYQNIMISNEVVICCTQKYINPWMKKQKQYFEEIKMIANNYEFKLGQQIQALCVWNPNYQCLHFVRNASQQQIRKYQITPMVLLPEIQQSIFRKIKNILLAGFQKLFSNNYSYLLLFSLLSDSNFFIDGPNVYQILKDLLPRVLNLKIKAPFKESLFPYKNQQGQLINTPMQLSSERTFVIIDFSQITKKQKVDIDGPQIDNLKALKIFVQEGTAVYRWEYGQSLFPHNHSGIIVKGSSIVCPHYKSEQKFEPQKQLQNPFSSMEQKQKHFVRAYLQQCLKYDPKVQESAKAKIQQLMKQQLEKQASKKMDLSNTMMFAKMNARSQGRNEITVEDYLIGRKISMKQ